MALSAKEALSKLIGVTHAWKKLRPGKSFSGLTLEQYEAKIQPSHDVRSDIAESETRLQSFMTRRVMVDAASLEVTRRVVDAVKSDPEEGNDGELYAAMGFVRKSDRSSGLTRRNKEREQKDAVKGDPPPKN